MQFWIITNSDEHSLLLRENLGELGFECPNERVVSTQTAVACSFEGEAMECVIFLAIDAYQTLHLRILEKLRSRGNAKVIIISNEAEPDNILSMFRSGATDVLTWNRDLKRQLNDLVGRFQVESLQRYSAAKLYTVVPCGPVSDSNLLALNLAAIIAHASGDCGLIDLHLRGGDLAPMLRLDPPHTLHELLIHKDGVDENMIEQAVASHPSGIHLLASPKMFSSLDTNQLEMCAEILSCVKSSRAHTVVNCESALQIEELQAACPSDVTVLTTRLDVVAIARTKETLRFLSSRLPTSASIQVVAMGTGNLGELPSNAVRKILGLPSLVCIPDDPVAINASLNIGSPLVIESPDSATSKALFRFAQSLPDLSKIVTPKDDQRQRLLSDLTDRFSWTVFSNQLGRTRLSH